MTASNAVQAGIDLVLSTSIGLFGPAEPGTVAVYDHRIQNHGTTIARDPCVHSDYDPNLLVHWLGGTVVGNRVEVCLGADLPPGSPPAALQVAYQIPQENAGDAPMFYTAPFETALLVRSEEEGCLAKQIDNKRLTVPHSIGLVDFDGDCLADLFVTAQRARSDMTWMS